jgi:hypothetical protein
VCRARQVLGVGDDSLDLVADLVDGPVVGLVVGVEGQVRGFSLRGDHAQPDVALVADAQRWLCPVREVGGGDIEQAGATQCLGIVSASVPGVGHHAKVPAWVQATCTLSPVVLCLPEYSSGWVLPGPALKEGAVHDQLGRGGQVLHRRHTASQGLGDQGHVGGDDPRDGGLRDAVDLGEQLLGQVVSQVGQCQAHAQEQTQHPGTEGRQVGTGGVNALAQVHNLAAGNPRATIRDGGLLPEVF